MRPPKATIAVVTAVLTVLVGSSMVAAPTAAATSDAATPAPNSVATIVDATSSFQDQEQNQTQNPTRHPTLVGDDDLHIVDSYKQDGRVYVELYAVRSAEVTISAAPESDADVAGGWMTSQVIPRRSYATVSIRSPTNTAWLQSADSASNGRFTRLDLSGPGYWPETFTGLHVLAAGAVAALMTAFAVLVDLVRHEHLEDRQQGERLDA